MATSVMAAGLAPHRAFAVAEAIERRLHADHPDGIDSSALRALATAVLAQEVGERYADNYRRWQASQHRAVPLVVLLGGTTGVGKSTVATTVAGRLGITRIVSTDAIREVMRGIFTRDILPCVHTSSFDVASLLPDAAGDADPVVAGFRQQVQAVMVGVSQIIRRAVVEGTDLVIEGAHVVPGYLTPPAPGEAVVASMVITVDDPDVHRSHFVARSADARSRGFQRYLDRFDDIRTIQSYVKALAVEHGVPVVPSYGLDITVSRVMELVLAATADQPHHPPRPATTAVPAHAAASPSLPAPPRTGTV